LHSNHRQRIKNRFNLNGLEGFSDYEVLEFLLFYAIPRQNTNEIAHKLIDSYGSLSAVFNADYDELLSIPSVGAHTATLIKAVPEIARQAQKDYFEKNKDLSDKTVLEKYIVSLFSMLKTERVYLLLFDNAYRLLDTVNIHEGSVNSIKVAPRILIEKALFKHASIVILAHNHPNGIAVPSSDDITTTKQLKFLFDTIDINFAEHYIVADNKITPICGVRFAGYNME